MSINCSLCSIFNCSSRNRTVKDNCILKHVEAITDIEKASIKYSYENPSERTNGLYDKSELEWAFEEGCKWQKEQMLKDAVDADAIFDYYDDQDSLFVSILATDVLAEKYGLKDKSKVKIIIIKEEENERI